MGFPTQLNGSFHSHGVTKRYNLFASRVLSLRTSTTCSIVFQGDGNIRYYEITNEAPYVHYLSEYRTSQPQRGFGVLPKRSLKVKQCEIFRLYKLHTSQPLVEPISFTVPRKPQRGFGVLPNRSLKVKQCEIFRLYKLHTSQPLVEPISFTVPRKPQRGFGVLPNRSLKVKQCEIFRLYKLHTSQPLVEPISFTVPRKPQCGFGVLPKRPLKVKQCEIFRLYKLHTSQPLVEPISFTVPRKPQCGFGVLPKRSLKVKQCEIFRLYKLHTSQPLVEPISFTVPRKPQCGFGVLPKRSLKVKQCEIFRLYKLHTSQPLVEPISFTVPRKPQCGFGVLPKRSLKVKQCEIFRLYKLHTSQPLVEPISFTDPRKSEMFQADLYPPTASPTPALSADEWACGIDREPVLMNLKQIHSNAISTTCKPVLVVRHSIDDGCEEQQRHRRQILITSDVNNDRKFRFLSSVTKPDYREVTERDDYDQIRREAELRAKLGRKQLKLQELENSQANGHADNKDRRQNNSGASTPVTNSSISEDILGSSRTGVRSTPRHQDPEGGDSGTSEVVAVQKRMSTHERRLANRPATDRHSTHFSSLSAASSSGDELSPRVLVRNGCANGNNHQRAYDSTPTTPGVDTGPPRASYFSNTIERISSQHQKSDIKLRGVTRPSVSSDLIEEPQNGSLDGSRTSLPQQNGKAIKTPLQSTTTTSLGSGSNTSSPRLGGNRSSPVPKPRSLVGGPALPTGRTQQVAKSDSFSAPQQPASSTRPGRIGPGPILPGASATAQVKPFLVSKKTPTTVANTISGATATISGADSIPGSQATASRSSLVTITTVPPGASAAAPASVQPGSADVTSPLANLTESPSRREAELQKLYAAQCKQVRSLLEDRETKERRVHNLELDLTKEVKKTERLGESLERKNEEIECLRHEIAWKDARIEELQNQLYRVAALLPDDALQALHSG